MSPFTVRPIDHKHHQPGGDFREQIAVLYFAGIEHDRVKFVRSFLGVGTSGGASFHPAMPGDSLRSWQAIDDMIENKNVRGAYHTHPAGAYHFSPQDWRLMRGLAKANGITPLFHGLQAVNHDRARFLCLRLVRGQVHCYDLGWFKSDLDDPVILLPLPPALTVENDLVIMQWVPGQEFADADPAP